MLKSLFRDSVFFFMETLTRSRYTQRERNRVKTIYLVCLCLMLISLVVNYVFIKQTLKWYNGYNKVKASIESKDNKIDNLSKLNKDLFISNRALINLELEMLEKCKGSVKDKEKILQFQQGE